MFFIEPQNVLKQFYVAPGMQVGDLGAGSGFYSMALADKVGKEGKVYAVEIQRDVLDRIKREAVDKGLSNIEIIWGDIEKIGGTKLQDNILDRIVASNVIFQLGDKVAFIKEARRLLKKEGKILIIDWLEDNGLTKNNFFPKKELKNLFGENSFMMEKEIDVGPHHYGIVFVKK